MNIDTAAKHVDIAISMKKTTKVVLLSCARRLIEEKKIAYFFWFVNTNYFE